MALGMVYVPPGTDQLEDPMQYVREGLTLVPHNSMIIMMGDFNARLGHQLHEEDPHCNMCRHVEELLEEEEEIPTTLFRRLADGSRNMYGRELERIAIQERLICLNGTYIEGAVSNYTCFANLDAPSVLDLGWCSAPHINRIQKLTVHNYMPDLSDHAPLGLTIQCDGEPWEDVRKGDKGTPPCNRDDSHNVEILKANWTETEKEQYLLYMSGETSRNEGRDITKQKRQ